MDLEKLNKIGQKMFQILFLILGIQLCFFIILEGLLNLDFPPLLFILVLWISIMALIFYQSVNYYFMKESQKTKLKNRAIS